MERKILNQEQISQFLEEGKLNYSYPEMVINDFLFVNNNKNYLAALNELLGSYFGNHCFSGEKEEAILDTFRVLSLICRNRELLIQIATDKGIVYNPKNQ